MDQVTENCLSCGHFRLQQTGGGLCRVDRQRRPDYPWKNILDYCDNYQNCGQNYYIRVGWIRGEESKKDGGAKNQNR